LKVARKRTRAGKLATLAVAVAALGAVITLSSPAHAQLALDGLAVSTGALALRV